MRWLSLEQNRQDAERVFLVSIFRCSRCTGVTDFANAEILGILRFRFCYTFKKVMCNRCSSSCPRGAADIGGGEKSLLNSYIKLAITDTNPVIAFPTYVKRI